MKIIFLDIDGVLNTEKYIMERFNQHLSIHDENNVSLFDPEMIEKLNKIINETGAKIVISSCWRILYTLEELRNIWIEREILGEIIDRTPITSMIRGKEVEYWLNKYGDKVDSYVILDDDTDFLSSQFRNLVVTSWKDGMSDEHVKKAISILNEQCKQDIKT